MRIYLPGSSQSEEDVWNDKQVLFLVKIIEYFKHSHGTLIENSFNLDVFQKKFKHMHVLTFYFCQFL